MVTFSFYTMYLNVQFNHFNCAHWVAVRCEAGEVTPAVAEASKASGSYLYTIIRQVVWEIVSNSSQVVWLLLTFVTQVHVQEERCM